LTVDPYAKTFSLLDKYITSLITWLITNSAYYLIYHQDSTEQMNYKKLMNTLAWFFFKLLVFEYVEDLKTGMTFRLPGGQKWKIFIEVATAKGF